MTSDTISVRDHSRPCEHGSLWPHWTEVARAKWWQEPECLGGREMILMRRPDGAWTEIPRGEDERLDPPSDSPRDL